MIVVPKVIMTSRGARFVNTLQGDFMAVFARILFETGCVACYVVSSFVVACQYVGGKY